MTTTTERDELENTSYSSGDDSYHQVESSDGYMSIINGDTEIRTQKPLQPIKQQNRVNLGKLHLRNIKLVASTFQEPIFNANKLGKMWGISTKKANYLIRTTTQTAVNDITKPLNRKFKTRKSLFRCQKN